MAKISWYGGVSLRAQRWPLNGAQSQAQPFVSGGFSKNPTGYGPVLERYFLGCTGVTVTVPPDEPVLLSLESNWHFCLASPVGRAVEPLHYTLCASTDIAAVHQHVLNLTRRCIQRHRDFVVPLLIKYSSEWLSWGYPIFRPAWWLSPTDPAAFTIQDEFLIGDEVLVAPVTEKGQTWRDIYLPGEGHLWMDTTTARVFDGGTILRNYSAGLAEVLVFVKTSELQPAAALGPLSGQCCPHVLALPAYLYCSKNLCLPVLS
ncbi:SITS-binding protein-like [Pezoporus flaviventris]|uniref:SITS-binding protein-like n=1 Tax=Pezoporus flaviventris TaxID=889875 RepID=UPI002AB13090|nr:SITS-binding protein-like [Pezoporus flaviventris]